MSIGHTLEEVFINTFVPTWIYSARTEQRQPESSSLDAFRQRIYMQQVTYAQVLYLVQRVIYGRPA